MDDAADADTDLPSDRADTENAAYPPVRGTGDHAALAPGSLIGGKYHLEEYIGCGSSGAVYRARHDVLEKPIALKILDPELARSPAMVELFKREARAASRLDHPNAVRVLDFGADGQDLLYIAMEFVEGPDLLQLLDDQYPFAPERVVAIMSQLLSALAQAHDLGVVHRDLKPENVLVLHVMGDEDGRAADVVKVCDFGVAQLSPQAMPALPVPRTGPQHPTVIDTNVLVGTPEYMSPEQARGESLDPRSDVYAAGVVLFQLLTRRVPFSAETAADVAALQCYAPPPRPSAFAPVPPALEAVCLKAMHKDPDQRYQTAREMRTALRQALAAQSVAIAAPAPAGAALARRDPTPSGGHALSFGFTSDPDTMTPPAALETTTRIRAQRRQRLALRWAVLSALAPIAAIAYLWPFGKIEHAVHDWMAPAPRAAHRAQAAVAPAAQRVQLPSVQASPRPSFDNLAVSVLDPGAAAPAPSPGGMAQPAAVEAPHGGDAPARERRSGRRSERAAVAAADAADAAQRLTAGDELVSDEALMTAMADLVVAPSANADAALPPTVTDAVLNAEPGNLAMRDTPAPEPKLGPQPVTSLGPPKAPAPPLRASTRIEDVVVRGSLATSVVQRAIARVRPQIAACYGRSAEAAGRNGFGVVRIEVELDERGRARRARAEGGALPGLDACISQAAARMVTRISPDTGTVKALWSVAFEP